eukprot:Rhum_TRINITY_DN18593_c0_g1::Rhum_TRINITY_DN18593_c0_g1_i1::g.167723::m.167723
MAFYTRAALCALLACAVRVAGSPKVVATESLGAYDEDCFKDDLGKNCGVSESVCRADCGKNLRCAAYVYNYHTTDAEGQHAQWTDGCCWLKTACSQVKPMKGKKRVVLRRATLHVPDRSPFERAAEDMPPSASVDDVVGATLKAFAKEAKMTAEEMKAEVAAWVVHARKQQAQQRKDEADLAANPPPPDRDAFRGASFSDAARHIQLSPKLA